MKIGERREERIEVTFGYICKVLLLLLLHKEIGSKNLKIFTSIKFGRDTH